QCPACRRAPAPCSTYVEFFRSGSSNSFNRARDGLLSFREPPARRALGASRFLATRNLYRADPALGLGTDQINMKQSVIQPRPAHFDAFGEDEGALELARGDAAMQVNPLRILDL